MVAAKPVHLVPPTSAALASRTTQAVVLVSQQTRRSVDYLARPQPQHRPLVVRSLPDLAAPTRVAVSSVRNLEACSELHHPLNRQVASLERQTTPLVVSAAETLLAALAPVLEDYSVKIITNNSSRSLFPLVPLRPLPAEVGSDREVLDLAAQTTIQIQEGVFLGSLILLPTILSANRTIPRLQIPLEALVSKTRINPRIRAPLQTLSAVSVSRIRSKSLVGYLATPRQTLTPAGARSGPKITIRREEACSARRTTTSLLAIHCSVKSQRQGVSLDKETRTPRILAAVCSEDLEITLPIKIKISRLKEADSSATPITSRSPVVFSAAPTRILAVTCLAPTILTTTSNRAVVSSILAARTISRNSRLLVVASSVTRPPTTLALACSALRNNSSLLHKISFSPQLLFRPLSTIRTRLAVHRYSQVCLHPHKSRVPSRRQSARRTNKRRTPYSRYTN